MKTRFLLVLALLFNLAVVPAYAHEDSGTVIVPGDHNGTPSIHARIDQFLKSVPDNHSFVVTLESKTANDLLLDVRTAENFQKSPIKDGLNVPLTTLHNHIKDLPRDKRIFVVGDSVDGAYAVFVLRLHGIDGWLVKNNDATDTCPLAEAHKKHH